MKKILLLLLLLFPLVAFAEVVAVDVNAPSWEDFVPKAFIDVKEPKGLGKLNVTAKYWYERKIEFENGMETCRALEDAEERFSCFDALKLYQYKKNNDYNAKLEAEMNSVNAIPEMQNRTDTMIPIGGYLDQMTRFMPNELRGY
ncbi:hypothetical protein IJO12_00730 [bacterium]|nr:hypothetical protein [bacterium]